MKFTLSWLKDHLETDEPLAPGKHDVAVKAIEPVGMYAIKLVFSDGHDTGIYSWEYLHDLGTKHESNWRTYLARLQQAGKSRET